jgi:hypothetical protein
MGSDVKVCDRLLYGDLQVEPWTGICHARVFGVMAMFQQLPATQWFPLDVGYRRNWFRVSPFSKLSA